MRLSAESCELFELPFFQFAQLKKYCPEAIAQIKADYKQHWETWKALHQAVASHLGLPFADPHIEKWCNGWQVRAHFFAYYKYECYVDSAAILSVILNRRRLLVSLDWHCYRAARSRIGLPQYNQWLEQLDRTRYADFELWHGAESEYADFRTVQAWRENELLLQEDNDFFCIGRSIEKDQLADIDAAAFISGTIRQLLPLYERCHL